MVCRLFCAASLGQTAITILLVFLPVLLDCSFSARDINTNVNSSDKCGIGMMSKEMEWGLKVKDLRDAVFE